MDRIAETFQRCREARRPAFVAYLCAGDPDAARSLAASRTLVDGGVDILELGVPFSDPLADGLTNQLAAQRALASDATRDTVFEQVSALRAAYPGLPIVFYTYFNLIYSQGIEAYVQRAAEAGLDGMLTLDCPPEEADALLEACARHGLKSIFIVAPTTTEARIATICAKATGFVYYVSLEGVTGERDRMAADIAERVSTIRKHTDLPVVVGFGISRPEHVASVGKVCDGVVVGSALVNCVAKHVEGPTEVMTGALGQRLASLLEGLPTVST
ncbi:MAG: tryptophan synthase subunit alpha [Opitutales bacterium]